MRAPLGYAGAVATCLLLALSASYVQAQVVPSISRNPALSPTTGPSTCPSRSLNYITQTLPQQCLTASWASKPASQGHATANIPPKSIHSHIDEDSKTRNATASASQTDGHQDSSSAPPILVTVSTFASESTAIAITGSFVEPASTSVNAPQVGQQPEIDSPLDNVNFLSFEEWKRQNLAKAGQSVENLGERAAGIEPRRRPGSINNALDSLGEDTEIDIDFGGFVNPGTSQPTGSPAGSSSEVSSGSETINSREHPDEDLHGVRKKGKDAGRTCKERSNYASFDCAATMMKTNPESKGANAVLVENKDSYMLNVCSAKNKFLIVELCDDILIDTVVLANFEFFSSIFRTFRISVSDRYPVKPDKWKDLGTYEAKNSREIQAFLVENPLIWARYLRVEFLTHFGNEYYCPVSLLRVHGTTMMEEFNHDLKRAGTEEENDIELEEIEEGASLDSNPGVVSAEASKERSQESSSAVTQAGKQTPSPSSTALVGSQSETWTNAPNDKVAPDPQPESPYGFTPYNISVSRQIKGLIHEAVQSCGIEDESAASASGPSASTKATQLAEFTTAADRLDPIVPQASDQINSSATSKESKATVTSIAPPLSEKNSSTYQNEQARQPNQTSINSAKTQPSSTQPPNANPTMQESFFKTVHKRLQLLESNSTLSLQYIEEQSRILRDAFSKVEKRQLAKSTNFLETLNNTVLTELRDFRTQYDQIWQSTVLELSSQREQSHREVLALSARLGLLADEVVFQKRVFFLQFALILLCLGLAIFSRSASSAAYLELPPVVQNAIGKSSISLSRYAPQFEYPSVSPSSTRPPSSYGLLRGLTHRRGRSDESQIDRANDGMSSPNIEYSPPSPVSQGSPGERSGDGAGRADGEEDLSDGSLHAKADAVRQTKSSPATPSGQREEQKSFIEGSV